MSFRLVLDTGQRYRSWASKGQTKGSVSVRSSSGEALTDPFDFNRGENLEALDTLTCSMSCETASEVLGTIARL